MLGENKASPDLVYLFVALDDFYDRGGDRKHELASLLAAADISY
jgi:hypothetical protein